MNDNLSLEIPLLTFNSLYNLLRGEKSSSEKIQILPELFYEAVDKFFEDKKQEIVKLEKLGNLDKLKKEKKILLNSQKILNEILLLRATKLSKNAINSLIYMEDSLGDNIIIQREIDFMDSVKQATKKLLKQNG